MEYEIRLATCGSLEFHISRSVSISAKITFKSTPSFVRFTNTWPCCVDAFAGHCTCNMKADRRFGSHSVLLTSGVSSSLRGGVPKCAGPEQH